MLARQQAEATVAAREVIVKGAVTIATGAIDGLEATGIQLSREEKARLVGNLLVVICGEARQERAHVEIPDGSPHRASMARLGSSRFMG